jgi:N-acetylmuramoyl-L-alanine amidase
MGSLYYDLASILSDAGCQVQVGSVNQGWERRARSSGGFSAAPLGVWWHHTASQTTIENDLQWQCHNCPDAPVGNMTLDRNGVFWPVAGGASNCAGKGGPANFSRGVSPTDQGNTTGFQIEVANNGVGEPWPQVQIDA